MRGLEEVTLSPLAVIPEVDASTAAGGGAGRAPDFSGWISDCHSLWHNLALIVSSALFVAFLAAQARRSLTKLSYGRSSIMISYYGLLWAVSLLNLLWCVLQVRSFAGAFGFWFWFVGGSFEWEAIRLTPL